MAGNAPRLIGMRERASRALGYAVLASIALHALALMTLPAAQELAALVPDPAEPLIARIERLQSPPPPTPAPAKESRAPAPARSTNPVKPLPELKAIADPAPVQQALPALAAPAQLAPAPVLVATAAPPPAVPPLDADALARYRQALLGTAASFKRYPRVAIDNNWGGEVVVRLQVGVNGRIAALRVARSSGYPVLDRQALQMFDQAKPEVPIPRPLRGRAFELELRAIYSLSEHRPG